MTIMRIYLTVFLLSTAMLLTGCSSVMMPGSSGASLFDQLPSAGRLSGSSTATDKSLEINFGMARVAERNDRVDQAVTAYHEILSKYPDHAPTLHRLGVVAARQGRMDEAMDYFSKAAELKEPSAELLGDIGYAQYLAKDYDAAAKTLQKAAYLSPDDERVVNNLAIVLGMQKRYGDSLELFRQTGSEAESLAGVAFTQSQTGQLEQAKSTYHRSLEIDSSLEVAANGLLELDRHARSAESDHGSIGNQQIANHAEVEMVTSKDLGTASKRKIANMPEPSEKSSGVLKSLATKIHERSGLSKRSKSIDKLANGKLAKPPVISLAALDGFAATTSGQSDDQPYVTGAGVVSNELRGRSTARIVMANAIAVPVAEAPSEAAVHVYGGNDGHQALSSSPSSRRPAEPSQVRQANYEEPVTPATRW